MKYNIFCYESGIIKERYMVLSGIILPHRKVEDIGDKIKYIKERKCK